MQNPFRQRAQDDFGRRRDETDRPIEYGSAEPRSWRDDDTRLGRGDRDRDRAVPRSLSQDQGYDANWGRGMSDDDHSDWRDDWSRARGRSTGADFHRGLSRDDRTYGGQDWGYDSGASQSRYTRRDYDDYRETGAYGSSPRHQTGEFGRDYGVSGRGRYDQEPYGSSRFARDSHLGRQDDWRAERQGQGQYQRGYASQGYAPGAQIWGEQDRDHGRFSGRHDFEPDYLHWRDQQLRGFDDDYTAWRDERRQKFSSDFDTWRTNRPKKVQTEAANPYVGDVSEGGTGDGDKLEGDTKTGKSRN